MKFIKSIIFLISILLFVSFPSWGFKNHNYSDDDLVFDTPIINSFFSQITVDKNSTLHVKEQLTIKSYDEVIKHGLYRDLSTIHKTKDGLNHHIYFKLNSALIDGKPVPAQIQAYGKGLRIRIGSEKTNIKPGKHIYTFNYTVNNALRYFNNHDELYWNVTGNEWKFPIEYVVVLVHLPKGASSHLYGLKAFTGYWGNKGNNYNSRQFPSGDLLFTTTAPLSVGQGFSIVSGWAKGYVTQPTWWSNLKNKIYTVDSLFVLCLGLIALIIFDLLFFVGFRRHNSDQIVIPLFTPPQGVSPAELCYINERGYDNQIFTTAIINMAVKGYLNVEKKGSRYILHKKSSDVTKLSSGEKIIAKILFSQTDSIDVSTGNAKNILQASTQFIISLKKKLNKKYFTVHNNYVKIGYLITAATFITAKFSFFESLFFAAPITFGFIAIACFFILFKFRSLGTHPKSFIFNAILSWVIYLIFIKSLHSDMMSVNMPSVSGASGSFTIVAFILFVLINCYSNRLFKTKTLAGAKIKAESDGFKMFLKATEQDWMNFTNPPAKTSDLFEKYLPYALALGQEQYWCQQFPSASLHVDGKSYQPAWYMGSHGAYFSAIDFSKNLSLFDGVIRSASCRSQGLSSSFHFLNFIKK